MRGCEPASSRRTPQEKVEASSGEPMRPPKGPPRLLRPKRSGVQHAHYVACFAAMQLQTFRGGRGLKECPAVATALRCRAGSVPPGTRQRSAVATAGRKWYHRAPLRRENARGPFCTETFNGADLTGRRSGKTTLSRNLESAGAARVFTPRRAPAASRERSPLQKTPARSVVRRGCEAHSRH